MFESFRRRVATPVQGRLPRLLMDYPPYMTPFPGDPHTLSDVQCLENLRHLLDARETRLEIATELLAKFDVDLRGGLVAEDPYDFLDSLDRWARTEWPMSWTPKFPADWSAWVSARKEGEQIALAMLMDVAILLGEIVVRKRHDYAWRVDLNPQNCSSGSYRRVAVAKESEGFTPLDFEQICISEFDSIGRGMSIPGHSLGSIVLGALEGGYDPDDSMAVLPPRVTAIADPAPRDPFVYDKAKYHEDHVADDGLDRIQAAVPAAFIVGWLASHGLLRLEAADIDDYLKRQESAVELYWRCFDGCLIEPMLTEEGNSFARQYFNWDADGYFDDLIATLAGELPSEYYIRYSFENQERMDAVIDQRFTLWRAENG